MTSASSPDRERSYQWIFTLTTGLLYGSAVLRTLLNYAGSPALVKALGLQLAFLVLLLGERLVSRRWNRLDLAGKLAGRLPSIFPVYLFLQTLLVTFLFFLTDLPEADFFAVLFVVLCMQIAQNFEPEAIVLWIGLFTVIMGLAYFRAFDLFVALSYTLLYSGASILLASFSLATRRAQTASAHNRLLVSELQEANRQLQEFTVQAERLAAARERSRLARELHDSVTQTLFSMNLATQSAVMLLSRPPESRSMDKVAGQLERLSMLAHGAQSEMQLLISELHPEPAGDRGLVDGLHRQLAIRRLRDGLDVSLDVVGELALPPAVEQRLSSIVHEALNNTLKHAQVSTACVHLHLSEPSWLEIEDHGVGFDPTQTGAGGGVGLAGMRERAAEIGWELHVHSAPGAGTRIHVAPGAPVERQAK